MILFGSIGSLPGIQEIRAEEAPPAKPAVTSGAFVMHRVGQFRGEACCAADFDNDGKIDIFAGEYLYRAPDWKARRVHQLKGSVDNSGKGYYWDFANIPFDVDGDGRLDVVSVDWFDKRSIWLRNPGVPGEEWPPAVIEENGNFEHAELADLEGRGRAGAIVPTVLQTVWYEVVAGTDGKRTFTKHVVSAKEMNWGVGVGDVNGDGRPDLLRPDAWFEAPADPRNGAWIEHPLALGHQLEGKADHTAQILVYDVNGDHLNDILCSSAHAYGVFWYEQIREGGAIRFRQHVIDDTWSQAHSLALGDLDGDGAPELVSGKRFMAHNGGDPGEYEPLGVYYYQLLRGPQPVWTKHAVSYNEGIGSGMNIPLVDLDGDGDLDIVVTGKWGGPVWFENRLARE
ncbi:MAG: FG-GAP repeat domain-containing protein [bacterium]